MHKLEIFCPKIDLNNTINTLHKNKIGNIGNYEGCLTFYKVYGSWIANEKANPSIESKNTRIFNEEYKIECNTSMELKDLHKVVRDIKDNSSYEEIVINIIELK